MLLSHHTISSEPAADGGRWVVFGFVASDGSVHRHGPLYLRADQDDAAEGAAMRAEIEQMLVAQELRMNLAELLQ